MTWSADGDKHEMNCTIGASAAWVLATVLGFPVSGSILGMTIFVWGVLFSPDLDLSDTGRKNGGGCKAWHRWKRVKLGWFWKPYGKAFKHRSVFSHTLIPGTLIRLIYVLSLPALFLFLAWLRGFDFWLQPLEDKTWAEQIDYFKGVSRLFLLVIGGCFIADAIHLSTDNISPKEWLL